MKQLLVLSLGMIAAGCAAGGAASSGRSPEAAPSYATLLVEAPALAFESPAGPPPVSLSRDARTPGAYLGYESPTSTVTYTRYDDRLRFEQGTGSFERRVIGERVGITVR